MARTYQRVNVGIWSDPDFRRLPPAAQHLYFLLWTSPDLSFCGVHDWRPSRLTHLSHGFTAEHTAVVAACLHARHFLVIDEATEEVLVRSWARFDETLKQPRLAVSYVKAYSATYSATLRSVLVHETKKMRDLWPELACWKDDRVVEILDHPAVSAKDLPSVSDPFGDGFGDSLGLGLAQTSGNVWGSVWVPPTPAPAPTPKPSVVEGGAGGDDSKQTRKRACPLPDDWEPSDNHRELAAELGIDCDLEATKMRDWAAAEGKTGKDWDARFRNWLRNARPGPPQPVDRRVVNAPVEAPPDGLTDEQLAAWYAEQARRRRA